MNVVNHRIAILEREFELHTECPFCKTKNKMTLPLKYLDSYREYISGNESVSSIFPTLNPVEREFLMTGYCVNCQKDIFGSDITSDKITHVE